MRRNIHFWFTTLARGFVALFFGSAIWFVPDMAGSFLLLPMAVALSVLILAAYGVIDSSLVLLSSTMPRSKGAAIALRAQGGVGMLVGVILFAVVYERVRLEWFFFLAGAQALCLGIAEVVVARHTANHAKTIWNYGASAVAFCFGFAYLLFRFVFADRLSSREICWLIYGYLLAFGLCQSVTSLRMLSARHRAARPINRGSKKHSVSALITASNQTSHAS